MSILGSTNGVTAPFEGLTGDTGVSGYSTDGVSQQLALEIIEGALVNLNETGIVTDGSGYVTEWTNSGSGGSAYDLDVVVATLSNSTTTTVNGKTAVQSSGNYGLEPTAGQAIASPATVFVVAKFSASTPSGVQVILSERSDGAASFVLQSGDAGQSYKFTINQGGTSVLLDEAYDDDPHVWIGQFNGGATTNLTVSGVGEKSGDAGSHNWDYGTLFANRVGGSSMPGYIAQLLVFDYALNASQRLSVLSYLKAEFGI